MSKVNEMSQLEFGMNYNELSVEEQNWIDNLVSEF